MTVKRKNLTESAQKQETWSEITEIVKKVSFDSTRREVFSPRLPELKNIHIFRRNEIHGRVIPNIHGYYVFWICLSGAGQLLINDAHVELQKQECVLVLPGQPHMRLPDDQGRRVNWLLLRFESEDHGWFAAFRNVRFKLSPQNAGKLLEVLTYYTARKSWNSSSACGAALLELLACLPQDKISPTALLAPEQDQSTAAYIRELCELMIQMPPVKDPFGLVARRWSITPAYLHTLFRKKTGYTSRDFLISQKMNLAQHLLVNSELSISEIALRCGFSGIYPFSRFFRQKSGMTPSAYRKKN